EGGLQPIGNISPMDISADGAVIVGSAGPGHSSPKQPPHNDISAAWWSLEETLLIEDFLALTGISADGTVGAASSLGGPSFLWTKQGIVNLGDLPGGIDRTTATGISADGTVVVGFSGSNASGTEEIDEGFIWTAE